MAFEPYLSDRFLGCYKAQRGFKPDVTDCSKLDKYTRSFRDRWNVLRQDPCKRLPVSALNDACCDLNCSLKNGVKVCLNLVSWANGQSLYKKDFKYPKSHNAVDDCCTSPCPCEDGLPNYCRDSKNSAYAPLREWETPCPPMDSVTTYKQHYHPHQVHPRLQRPPEPWDPCVHPLEECTTTRVDYTKKVSIPNGPSNSEVIKHGLWSFCQPFTDETTTQVEYPEKFACRPTPSIPVDNFIIPNYPLKTDTESRSQFYCKVGEAEPTHCRHPWLDNGTWHPSETPLDSCTTYNHFYKSHPVPPAPSKCTVESPDAIPFCSINHLCYSCYDPVPDQKPPVELKDNDPWPFVKPCAIRYQDNLTTDPCAKFNDETTQKADYTAKALCRPNPSFAPVQGFIPPIQPLNDDTTMKLSYPAYSSCQYREAKTCAGNPRGIKWGLNSCPGNVNHCLPRFPSPFGDPLKPFNCQHCKCPCGPFDPRSSYNQDYLFRSQDQVDVEEEERCRKINVPPGVSLYRFDYVRQPGKKAAIMPPPKDKAYRCMHPCSVRDLDSLTRVSFKDFWKTMDRAELELYRGKPVIRTKRQKDCDQNNNECCDDVGDEENIIYQPVYMRVPKKKCPCQNEGPVCGQPEPEQVDQNPPDVRRCL